MRDRLIELMRDCCEFTHCLGMKDLSICTNQCTRVGKIADHLLAEGVIVPPCKVGDTVYVITNCENILMHHDNDYFTGTGAIECPFENSCDFEECDDSNLRIFETRVVTIHCEADFGWTFWCEHIHKDFMFSEIGETVFITREEAERALERRKNET